MSTAKAKTINLLLEDGTLNGVISIEDSSWNSGELYSAPRNSIDDLVSSEACKKFGVYLLISDEKVYIGQASDLAKRIKQHIVGKDWWERAIVLTTVGDTLNRSDIDYLESVLINLASLNNRLDCDNKNKGNKQKVSRFRKVELDQWLEEALLLMELIGVTVFTNNKPNDKKKKAIINTIEKKSNEEIEIRAKRYAKLYLEENGYKVDGFFSYAQRQEKKEEFWINPRTELLSEDWKIVLNNQFKNELIVIEVPAGTFILNDGKQGFFVRKDKTEYIDLNINSESFIDRRSKYSFESFIKYRIKY